MIISFEVGNYKSFAASAKVDLGVGAQAPDTFMFAPLSDGSRATKVTGVFGANASGKTSLLRALPAVADFLTDSFGYKPDAALPFEPHFFAESPTITLALEFELGGEEQRRYRYALTTTEQRVVSESLRVKTSRSFSRVFERVKTLDGYHVVGLGEKFRANLRENVSWLSWLVQYNVPEAAALVDYFKRIRSNLPARGTRMPTMFSAFSAVEYFRTRPDDKARMVSQLNRWDIGIDDVEFERAPGPDGTPLDFWMAYCVHRKGERKVKLSILSESSGTLGLFSLLSIIQPVLENGGVAVIDELEADLHPHMLEAVISLFVQPESNPHQAQLLFTSHADWVMSLLHKSQIVLVEKAPEGSTAHRLSDVAGVQARENYSARYRAGAYGAIPELH